MTVAAQVVVHLLEDEEAFDPKSEAHRLYTQAARTCQECGADLGRPGAVIRSYHSKMTGRPSINCVGHYDTEGSFEPDHSVDHDLVGYDLFDDSDTCYNCDTPV
jgi:hypothetical protein